MHDVGHLRLCEGVLATGAAGAVGLVGCWHSRRAPASVRWISDPAAESRLPAGCEVRVVDRITPPLSAPSDAGPDGGHGWRRTPGAMLSALVPADA